MKLFKKKVFKKSIREDLQDFTESTHKWKKKKSKVKKGSNLREWKKVWTLGFSKLGKLVMRWEQLVLELRKETLYKSFQLNFYYLGL